MHNASHRTWRNASILVSTLVVLSTTINAAEVQLGVHRFTLPDGFEIEQIAGPPLVNRPICADFDEQGRLYVADSSGSNDNVQTQLEQKPHRVVRLEDSDGDGRFDKSVVFAEKLMFPEGALWHDGSLYVSAPPEIWKLTDTDGDGSAEEREVWFDGKTLTGCANDLHGPYLGPDGWIYWCKGAFAEQTYKRGDARPDFVTRAAHIFRMRPEGGLVEPVMTGGMDNPVEVVFTPGGERIFTTTFLQHPGNGLRDGLIHAIYGGVYGKVHGVLEGHPLTGPIMPPLVHLGPAAPCGLVRLETEQLGSEYRDNVLACLFNMHKLTRHVLTPQGATFKSQDSDFLVSDNIDFHPTDVIEDADGSLLVVDTGGWYKLCCPTSNLWKPDILGAIYRIRRSGAHNVDDPRGQRIEWASLSDEELSALLTSNLFAVRRRAQHELGRRGGQAVAAIEKWRISDWPTDRLQAVWALTRIDAAQAREAVRESLQDTDETVRQAAIHSVSVWRDRDAELPLLKLLTSTSPQNQRAAAEALGRIGSSKAVASLLEASAKSVDRIGEHSLTYALIEIGDSGATSLGLVHKHPGVRRAALIALDQMPGGKLDVAQVRPLLDNEQDPLHSTAWWIAEHHPEWGVELANYFKSAIPRTKAEPDALALLTARLARFSADAAVQRTMAEALADQSLSSQTKVAVISAMTASGLKELPEAWAAALAEVLQTADAATLEAVVKAVSTLSGAKLSASFVSRLQQLAHDERLPAGVRLQSLVALSPEQRQIEDSVLLRFLCDCLAVDNPVAVRAFAVDVLLGTPLDPAQIETVAAAVAHAGPMELQRLTELFGKSSDERIGLQLLASLEQCPAASSLPLEALKQLLAIYGSGIVQKSEPLIIRIEQENAAKYSKLESILELVADGDIRRGQRVFHDTKAACVACHTMGYLGGRAGPDLTRIGKIRSERDLLESILFPSASFVRSYEPIGIVTADGKVHNGVILDETSSEITLQLDPQKVERIAVAEIEERVPGTVSIMPTGLDNQLTPRQLADLVTFLKAA